MITDSRPKVFGTGLISLDLVIGPDPKAPIRTWAGGTCGNVLSILAFLGWDAFPIARMSTDVASRRVRSDMAACGVHLDFIDCAPTTHTPIIVQEIRRGPDGASKHRFSWSCPYCGKWLPGYRAITVKIAEGLLDSLVAPSVFFLDRLSRGALDLAAKAAASDAVVVFEPSAASPDRLVVDAVNVAHVIKYADDRLSGVPGAMTANSATLLEVQTLGSKGLRYRHRFGRGVSNWINLNAIPAPRVADTCGSGDWCTAGLIAKLCVSGRQALLQAGAHRVRRALRFGQALAAWNCGFEGARGGMYTATRQSLDAHVDSLLNGGHSSFEHTVTTFGTSPVVTCPACPPEDSDAAY